VIAVSAYSCVSLFATLLQLRAIWGGPLVQGLIPVIVASAYSFAVCHMPSAQDSFKELFLVQGHLPARVCFQHFAHTHTHTRTRTHTHTHTHTHRFTCIYILACFYSSRVYVRGQHACMFVLAGNGWPIRVRIQLLTSMYVPSIEL